MYKATVLTSHLEHRPHPDPELISCCCWDESDREQPDFLSPGVWLWTASTSCGDIHPPPCSTDKSRNKGILANNAKGMRRSVQLG